LLKSAEERRGQKLGWILPDHLVGKALNGERIECTDLNKDLHLKLNLLDENVNWVVLQ